MTDGNGNIRLTQSYSPFGEVLNKSGDGNTNYAFTGEMYDPGTGLVILRARYYSTYLNQFIQPDTIVLNYLEPQNLNLYTYVQNNPIRFTDPSGNTPYEAPFPTTTGRDDRDLIRWLYNELVHNANSYYTKRINALLNGPIYDKYGNHLTYETAAQFHIEGYEDYYNNCGQVIISAILHSLNKNITAKDVVETMNAGKETTGFPMYETLIDSHYN